MELKILKDEKNELEIQLDNQTVAEILRVYLNEDKDVNFAAWKKEHYSKPLVLKIESSNKKPHKVINDDKNVKEYPKAYIRVGEKSIEASREMTRFLKSLTDERPLKIGIGENEKRLFEFIERNGRATVKDFAKIVNISTRRAERIMIKLVRAGVLQIHNDSSSDYFTLV